MSQTLIISDSLYARLEEAARLGGLSGIEQLLEAWQKAYDEFRMRQSAVRQVDRVREHIFAVYGEMPDSVDLIRDDRTR